MPSFFKLPTPVLGKVKHFIDTNNDESLRPLADFLADYIFLYNHAAVLFKRSHFLEEFAAGNIKTMDDVIKHTEKYPEGRAAKLWQRRKEHPFDPELGKFFHAYMQNCTDGKLCRSSEFFKGILAGKINTYEEAKQYAELNPETQMAKFMQTYQPAEKVESKSTNSMP